MVEPKIEGLMESICSITSHRIAFIASEEDRRSECRAWPVRGEEGDLYGLVEVDSAGCSVAPEHESVYAQLGHLIAHEIDLRRINLSLENRFRLLDRQNAELAAINRALSDMAYRDPLSTLYRRWYLTEQCKLEMTRATRHDRVFSMLMIDLDFFKRVNDTHGHAAGDSVLREFATLLQGSSRNSDVLARFGGDEFCALLTDTPADGAMEVAERIRSRCEQQRFQHAGQEFRLTCSIGVASYSRESGEVSIEAILDDIDRAMYRAKEAGRNGIRVAPVRAMA